MQYEDFTRGLQFFEAGRTLTANRTGTHRFAPERCLFTSTRRPSTKAVRVIRYYFGPLRLFVNK